MNRLKNQQEEHFQQRSEQDVQDKQPQNSPTDKKKHVFKEGEGEYVDFEEE